MLLIRAMVQLFSLGHENTCTISLITIHYLYNIPHSPSYGVYISQLIRYARASTLYDDFVSRSSRLTSKLFKFEVGL